MSDTVSGAVIAGSLGDGDWTFLPLSDAAPPDALHVNGAAYADSPASALLVEFRTLSPDWQTIAPAAPPDDAGPSVAGGYVTLAADSQPAVIAGGLQQNG